jgi:hypothetical protein
MLRTGNSLPLELVTNALRQLYEGAKAHVKTYALSHEDQQRLA